MDSASLVALLVKRCILTIIGLGLVSGSCFGQSKFSTVSRTPYDRQMVRVRPILAATNGRSPNQISSASAVSQWMSELRAVPYQYSNHWQTPAEVNLAQTTDCKGKAVALYARMRRNGAKNLRIVIGKHHIYDSATHAWVEWETPGGSYVLDPTFREMPEKKLELNPMTYIPFYAYDGEHKYRAVETGVIAPSTTRVAQAARLPLPSMANDSRHLYVPANAGTSYAHRDRISAGPGPTALRAEAPNSKLQASEKLQISSSKTQSLSASPKYVSTSTQYLHSNVQQSASGVRRLSPSTNVTEIRRSGAMATKPTLKHATTVQAKSVVLQKRPAKLQHPSAHASNLRQAGRSSQNGKHLTQAQPKPGPIQKSTLSPSVRLSRPHAVGLRQAGGSETI